MASSMDRRGFLGLAAAAGLAAGSAGKARAVESPALDEASCGLPVIEENAAPHATRPLLTRAGDFVDVSRGNPKPYSLKGEAKEKARLTTDTWRLEITSDGSAEIQHPNKVEDNTALDYAGLLELGKAHALKVLKGMQCNNIPAPLGQGLWEGVPLRDVLARVGRVANVRRVYFWGFHNNDPKQLFQSSLGYNQVMETPPWDVGPMVAYRLNGEEIPPQRGGPVRMLIPWAHGFKSIKWLQSIVLTNDYKTNDTYALQNNDPESYLKTAAYLDAGPAAFKAGTPVTMTGTAMSGWSGLLRVEYWIRPDAGNNGKLALDDPAWKSAEWPPCQMEAEPDNWASVLPEGVDAKDVWGFDRATGRAKQWPLRYSVVAWSAALGELAPGSYEFRARAVDLNGIAQPEPRVYQKSGLNLVQCRVFKVEA